MTGHIRMEFTLSQRRLVVFLGMCQPILPRLKQELITISSVFNDFGPKFTCVDPTGEQPLTGMIVEVDKASLLSYELP